MIKKLSDLLIGIALTEIKGTADVPVTRICFDSREVAAGSLFVAVRGTLTDGHRFIARAEEQGAVAVVCEAYPEVLKDNITYVKVADSPEALGLIASGFYDHPSSKLRLVGITGTNGKTTVATLLYQLFEELGYKSGLLSTVENHIHHTVVPATHTTPDPVVLNSLLAEMVDAGCDFCFMEVSSHAVAQHRIAGLNFTGGVFTNLTHDHLDFHKTFGDYLKAKKTFFDKLGKTAFALTNADDRNGGVMLQNTPAHQKTYALKNMADFKARVIEDELHGLLLDIGGQEVWFRLVGSFNAYNLLAAFATAMLLEQDKNKVLTVLSRLQGAEGRFDAVKAPDGTVGIVDYAHTPDAVKNVLSTIHSIRKGAKQVITVIGCGGDRDRAKRPVMARVACELSDKVILTSDNPRSEDPEAIIREMEEGIELPMKKKVLKITDRREAIKTACHLAGPGDIVLVAGKGHEKYQEIKGVKYPFDDKKIVKEQFNQVS